MVSFSKKMKPTDVGCRFSWHAGRLQLLPPMERDGNHEVGFVAVDADGKVWSFTCSVHRRGPHPKPVLTGSSWLPFVREKGLAVDDFVVFYYNEPTGLQIRVQRLKTIKLMGCYITSYAGEE